MSSFRERGVLLYGEAPPERGTTYRLQIYKSVRISNTWKGREICHLGISKGLPSKYCERTLTMGNFLCSPSPISSTTTTTTTSLFLTLNIQISHHLHHLHLHWLYFKCIERNAVFLRSYREIPKISPSMCKLPKWVTSSVKSPLQI